MHKIMIILIVIVHLIKNNILNTNLKRFIKLTNLEYNYNYFFFLNKLINIIVVKKNYSI